MKGTKSKEDEQWLKDQPGGKKTMKKYLWSLEMATYDAAHPQG